MPRTPANDTLFYGDNLHILREYVDDERSMGIFPRIQIVTVEDLFNKQGPVTPWRDPSVFRKARREATGARAISACDKAGAAA